jgi:hypothetical protein
VRAGGIAPALPSSRSRPVLPRATSYRCELCLEPVDPGSPTVYPAGELVYAGTVNDPYALAERKTVFFHRACWPGEIAGYRLRRAPA